MTKNIALITGITGQDGSFLSEFLLDKDYEVHCIIRRSSVDFRERIGFLRHRRQSCYAMGGWESAPRVSLERRYG